MKALLVAMILVGGCGLPTSDPWNIRAGMPPQPMARADIGLDDTADVGVGDAWISLHDYGAGDVSYPIVGVPGGGLAIESVFDPTLRMSHAQLQTQTQMSQGTEPASDHPGTQFATIFVDIELVPRLWSHASGTLATTGMTEMKLFLTVAVPSVCDPPPTTVSGEIQSCFTEPCPSSQPIMQLDDGTYQVSTLRLAIDVLPQPGQCAS